MNNARSKESSARFQKGGAVTALLRAALDEIWLTVPLSWGWTAGPPPKVRNEFADRLAKKVRFTVGLFCFEAYDDSLIAEITSRLGVPSWRIDKLNAAGSEMQVTLRDGGQKSIPLSELAGHVKPGCRHCTDFTAKMADISVGSVGSAPGMSTVISRTEEGLGLLEIAEEMGFLEAEDGVNVEAVEKVGTLKLKRNGF